MNDTTTTTTIFLIKLRSMFFLLDHHDPAAQELFVNATVVGSTKRGLVPKIGRKEESKCFYLHSSLFLNIH